MRFLMLRSLPFTSPPRSLHPPTSVRRRHARAANR
ncbi:unnamed protein product [Spirodela intermedia]|uniref:Uncharacterized protein n=1 Tax=Spirodela intermedia TaxID=51605 RepID=A0A7I8IEH0_SPIIN|nr:unnamed protein product [Spirodela intermedia]CAA6656176.1 unnamed protein product [Spirodela intermedia]